MLHLMFRFLLSNRNLGNSLILSLLKFVFFKLNCVLFDEFNVVGLIERNFFIFVLNCIVEFNVICIVVAKSRIG